MHGATKNRTADYALGREISGKKAPTSPLPLIAPPLNSCFPRRSRPLTVRTGQCSGYVKNSPCPSAKKVNTSQKNWETVALGGRPRTPPRSELGRPWILDRGLCPASTSLPCNKRFHSSGFQMNLRNQIRHDLDPREFILAIQNLAATRFQLAEQLV